MRVEAANGIALSDDGSKLYVAGFPEGITVVDLSTDATFEIPVPGKPLDVKVIGEQVIVN